MVLLALCGNLGAGKTLGLTYLAWRNYQKNQKIYANYDLKLPHKRVMTVEDLTKMQRGFAAMDELWLWLDCTTPDTKIITHDNVLPIEQCMQENPLQSVNFDNNNIENSESTCLFKRQAYNEELIELKTSVYSIKASKNHKFFIFDDGKVVEKKLKYIKKNDKILVVEKTEEPKSKKIDYKIADFIGYLFGDGTIYWRDDDVHWKKRLGLLKFDDAEKDILEAYSNIFRRNYGINCNIRKYGKCYRMTLNNREFVRKLVKKLEKDKNCYLDKWGIRFKDIPDCIIKSNNKVLSKFLRGLFDAEGYIYLKDEKSKFHKTKIATHTKIMLSMNKNIDMERLKYLLLRFGIRCSFSKYKHVGHTLNNRKVKTTYSNRITIRDRKSILRFHKYIGFNSKRKQKKLLKCVKFIKNRKIMYNKAYSYPNSSGSVVKKIKNSNLNFEKVLSVKPFLYKSDYVYDLSVPTHENYIANGFVVHNSRASMKRKNMFVGNILLTSRKKDVQIAYTTQSFSQVDVRIRRITDFIAMPQLTANEDICRMIIFSNPGLEVLRTYKFRTAPIFKLYDTREIINVLPDDDE